MSAIKKSERILIATLIPERFYDGIDGVISMIGKLESEGMDYEVFINDTPESIQALLGIKSKVDSVALEDFR